MLYCYIKKIVFFKYMGLLLVIRDTELVLKSSFEINLSLHSSWIIPEIIEVLVGGSFARQTKIFKNLVKNLEASSPGIHEPEPFNL